MFGFGFAVVWSPCFVYVWFSFGRFGVAVFLLYPALALTVLIAMDFVFSK